MPRFEILYIDFFTNSSQKQEINMKMNKIIYEIFFKVSRLQDMLFLFGFD